MTAGTALFQRVVEKPALDRGVTAWRLSVPQQRQRQRRDLFAPQRVRARGGAKTIAGKEIGHEQCGKPLDDETGQLVGESLGRCLQRRASPSEDSAQRRRKARKKNLRGATPAITTAASPTQLRAADTRAVRSR